jgi:hypothetical protein
VMNLERAEDLSLPRQKKAPDFCISPALSVSVI